MHELMCALASYVVSVVPARPMRVACQWRQTPDGGVQDVLYHTKGADKVLDVCLT